MTENRTSPTMSDDIDRIVDVILDDPRRVDDMKRLLRTKMSAPDDVSVLPNTAPVASRAVEPDDMWDNVPV